MKNFVITTLLLAVIIISFGTIILSTAARGSENNFFNQNLRRHFAHYRFARRLLQLHNDGDAASDYLGKGKEKIVIEVDEMNGLNVPTQGLDLLTAKISQVTGKNVSYYISDTDIPYKTSVSDAGITDIGKQYANFIPDQNTAVLYLMYLSSSADQPDELGQTYEEFGMTVFADPLARATAANTSLFATYFESTALHEFGHQLGLGHNDTAGCLMQAFVEQQDIVRENIQDVITDFCSQEKQLIQAQAR